MVFTKWRCPLHMNIIHELACQKAFQMNKYLVSVSVQFSDDLNGSETLENTKIITTWRVTAGIIVAPVRALDPADRIIVATQIFPSDPILIGSNIQWTIITSEEDRIVVATVVGHILKLCMSSVPKFSLTFDPSGFLKLYVTGWLMELSEENELSLHTLTRKKLFDWTPIDWNEVLIGENPKNKQRVWYIPIGCYARDSFSSFVPMDEPVANKRQHIDPTANLQIVGGSSSASRPRAKDMNLHRMKTVFDNVP